MKLISITPSSNKNKKYKAILCYCKGESKCCDKDKRTVHFGHSLYQDYTTHHDKSRRDNYRKRAYKGASANPDTPAALSYYILWGDSTSLRENIKSYKAKFNL